MASSICEGIGSVVHLNTQNDMDCIHCDQVEHLLDAAINHYIKAHGYRLLHVGQETSYDDDANPWYMTAAVLGLPAGEEPLNVVSVTLA